LRELFNYFPSVLPAPAQTNGRLHYRNNTLLLHRGPRLSCSGILHCQDPYSLVRPVLCSTCTESGQAGGPESQPPHFQTPAPQFLPANFLPWFRLISPQTPEFFAA